MPSRGFPEAGGPQRIATCRERHGAAGSPASTTKRHEVMR
jgi:hypothetical protein